MCPSQSLAWALGAPTQTLLIGHTGHWSLVGRLSPTEPVFAGGSLCLRSLTAEAQLQSWAHLLSNHAVWSQGSFSFKNCDGSFVLHIPNHLS